MGFLGNLFNEEMDELLFFIPVFLYTLGGNRNDESLDRLADGPDNRVMLFFIILLLILFITGDYGRGPKEKIVE